MKPARRALLALPVALLVGCRASDPYQGLDAATLFSVAETEYADGDFDNAIEALERLLINFTDFDRLPDARMMLAEAYFEQEDFLTARSEFQRFRDRYVAHPRSAEAALGECRALAATAPHPQRDQTYTREAVMMCGNVTVDYVGTPEAARAREVRDALRFTLAEKEYLNAEHYFRRKQYDPAILYYQFVVDLYPDSEFAPRALLGLYNANLEIGYDDLAEEARARLLREYPQSEAATEIVASGNEP